MAPSWSDLPIDVLQIVCEKLIDIKDYARFGAVCSPWQTVLWLCRKKIPPQLPVLMLPNLFCNSECPHSGQLWYTHGFFSPTHFHKDVLPVKQYIRCSGSSHGWLLTTEHMSDATQLLNPFLSVNNVIQLPSFGDEILKVVLSDNPTWTINYTIMVKCRRWIKPTTCRLAFFKPGDKSWTYINQEWDSALQDFFSDIVYYKDQYYAFSFRGEVWSYDISLNQLKLTKMAQSLMKMIDEFHEDCYDAGKVKTIKLYLVESSGDLLCVGRQLVFPQIDGEFFARTVGFGIFKFQARKQEWIELKTLSGHAIFFSDSFSLSVSSDLSLHCKPNCIYFASNKHDMGVFNLEDASFQPLIPQVSYRISLNPIWVQPTLSMVTTTTTTSILVDCDAVGKRETIEEEEKGGEKYMNKRKRIEEEFGERRGRQLKRRKGDEHGHRYRYTSSGGVIKEEKGGEKYSNRRRGLKKNSERGVGTGEGRKDRKLKRRRKRDEHGDHYQYISSGGAIEEEDKGGEKYTNKRSKRIEEEFGERSRDWGRKERRRKLKRRRKRDEHGHHYHYTSRPRCGGGATTEKEKGGEKDMNRRGKGVEEELEGERRLGKEAKKRKKEMSRRVEYWEREEWMEERPNLFLLPTQY